MSHRFVFLLVPMLSSSLFAATGYDGPAQLPIATVSIAMAKTPAPGPVVNVNAGDDLQAVLNNAQCGNTIQLQAGATFAGRFTVPALTCDNNHWIIIRTSAPDSALPSEGQRITPCYAGVASLPGRPQYSCNNPQNVLVKLVSLGGLYGPVIFQNGANHIRMIGLEVTRTPGTTGALTLISVAIGGAAHSIVLDRSWVHGTTQDETKDGFKLTGTNLVAVVNSYFSDFHCTSISGSCSEAHAIGGGNGNNQDGPFRIENNFLESSGQGILFGGAAATATPTDITIRNNHFFKPWQWMPGHVPFQGGDSGNAFISRHAIELKNAVRVLMENNLIENVWGGFGEPGYAVLITPKNQHTSAGNNVCPICKVTDITFRYSRIIHAGSGIAMATLPSGSHGDGAPAQEGARFSVHDVVLDDISKKYSGGGRLFQVASMWPTNPLNAVTIDHITGFPDANGGILALENLLSYPQMYGFVFTNSIVVTGKYPVWNMDWGKASCAYADIPLTSLNACFSSYTFNNNLLVASPANYPASSWPSDSLFASSPDDVGFVQYNGGNGGNYQLQSSSPYKKMGLDGKNLGADIAKINDALAGVE